MCNSAGCQGSIRGDRYLVDFLDRRQAHQYFLEACKPGEAVTLGCVAQMTQVQFWVHNPNEMPREIQLQVFQRSFSTKGAGRGLGTYSIKLLTERYLKGAASFVSGKDGTIFRVSYPLSIGAT